MKNIRKIAAASALGLAICGFVMAQGRPDGAPDHGGSHFKDSASAVKFLTEVYAKVAPFDANKDGQLDEAEKASFAKAIVDRTVQLPAHTPPDGLRPSAKAMLDHIAGVYAHLSKFDANQDGQLDEQEQAAVKDALEKGNLPCAPGQHSSNDRPAGHAVTFVRSAW